ncbi:MAG: hypothetical protein OQL09_04095 [Gammaproteobacteria bacterium]|nr:hypothetical protein [Gammaproteobacteria bacterium]
MSDENPIETENSENAKLHEYAGGDITERAGKVNRWLWPVYLILFIWALYYGIVYWGGLGPGLDY